MDVKEITKTKQQMATKRNFSGKTRVKNSRKKRAFLAGKS
jgi:hypothetical protein